MSSRPRRRVALPSGKNYHFNVIYNNAKSKLSKTSDTELSLEVTKYFIERAKKWGYDLSYYVDRNALPGQNIFTELFKVIDSSMYTIVILTNEFASNDWVQYCQQSALKSLLDSQKSCTMIPVLVGISDKEKVQNLSLNRHASFTETDWKTDEKEWDLVRQMMKDKTFIRRQVNGYRDVHPSSQHQIQETGTPGTTTEVAQAVDTPSLSQFNRLSLETDGPRSSNASSTAAHGSSTQREKSQTCDGKKSDHNNFQQAVVEGSLTVGGASGNAGMSETGDAFRSDSIGSMQNQSDLDLDHGSFPSGDGPQPVIDAESQGNQTSLKGDHSVGGDRFDQSVGETLLKQTGMDSGQNTSTTSLSSSTNPYKDKLVSDNGAITPQKLSESCKSEGVFRESDAEDPAGISLTETSGKKPAEGTNQQNADDKLNGPSVNSLTNGKPRTRRASMIDLARPAMKFLGNWILKPAQNVG